MIVQSDPIKIAEALLKKAYHTVKFASPNNNQVYLEADRKIGKTPEFWNKILTGKTMCCLFPADNWHGSIVVEDYHAHDFKDLLPDNLAGGICDHGLVPLQSIKKKLGGNERQGLGWLLWCVTSLGWPVIMSVLIYKSPQVLKSKNRVIAVFLLPGDPRLEHFDLFLISHSPYCCAIHPVRSLERIPVVGSSDTIEFDLVDAIPYQFNSLGANGAVKHR